MTTKTTFLALTLIAITMMGCKTNMTTTTVTPEPAPATEKKPKTMPQGRLLEVDYKEHGMRMPAFGDFQLNRRSGTPTLSFYHWSEKKVIEVPDSLFDVARRIMEEEKMYEYDSYYDKTPKGERILDGTRWDFSAYFEGKQYISSGGFDTWPQNVNGIRRLVKLLTEAAKTGTQGEEE